MLRTAANCTRSVIFSHLNQYTANVFQWHGIDHDTHAVEHILRAHDVQST